MHRFWILAAILGLGLSAGHTVSAHGPAETVVEAEQVLSELMAIPGKQIPHRLLEDAQGIVVIPNVIKIGFVAGARRGHGVVLVRDHDGEWSLPQFLTLTGGSVGWQAGIQGTDVVLIFTTRKGVEGLMNGKFTVGVDASVSAGPVGREAAAGTDATLRSEILSYSRSRGLFVGASLEGTALEIDHEAHAFYYGTPTGTLPRRVPIAASELRHFLSDLSPKNLATHAAANPAPAPVVSPRMIEGLRRSLNRNSDQLQAILSPEWRPYLTLPKELQQPGTSPSTESLTQILGRFTEVSQSPDYRRLAQRPEFQTTFELLREYERAIVASNPTLQLPPPPKDVRRE
jgi:lipid-binding SYLF domain-containing protein